MIKLFLFEVGLCQNKSVRFRLLGYIPLSFGRIAKVSWISLGYVELNQIGYSTRT